MAIHCPRCGQEQVGFETRFCSRCGFLMTGMAEIVSKGGLPPEFLGGYDPKAISPKKRGLKQGALMMLSSLILVPVIAILSASLGITPVFVALTAILTFWGGLLRILYALIFESSQPTAAHAGFVDSFRQNLTGRAPAQPALPPQQAQPAEDYFRPPMAGNWRDTNDLQPTSVTEDPTRTLDKSKLSGE
jgi:hypothetical protein